MYIKIRVTYKFAYCLGTEKVYIIDLCSKTCTVPNIHIFMRRVEYNGIIQEKTRKTKFKYLFKNT